MNASVEHTSDDVTRPASARSGKRWLFRLVYPIYLLLLGWVGVQLYWLIQGQVLGQSKTDVWGYFYPKLPAVRDVSIRNDDETLDILLLGASVLEQVVPYLETELEQRATRPVRLFSVCTSAHTSRDSYLKYTQLSEKRFDLIVIYHGVNDVRMNCVRDDLFKSDYKHCYFYELLERKVKAGSLNIKVMLQSSFQDMITRGGEPEANLSEYGKTIKTREPFKENLRNIVTDARSKSTNVILMTFAYYLPENYSREKLQDKTLDYGDGGYVCPVEIWGKPAYVTATLDAHNEVIANLAKSENVVLVDQKRLIPDGKRYFCDIVHLTQTGCEKFVENLMSIIEQEVSLD